MMKTIFNISFLFILVCSCKQDQKVIDPKKKHIQYTGTFSATPVNMGSFNSQFDDYNSTAPIAGEMTPLCFSTNRYSNGGNFDIIYKDLSVELIFDNGQLTVSEALNNNPFSISDYFSENMNINEALPLINTSGNEFGPNLINYWYRKAQPQSQSYSINTFIFLYASDSSGNLDIKFTENISADTYTTPKNISYLNSSFDDAYPTLISDSSKIFFCSNRNGNFDIFSCDLNANIGLLNNLKDTSVKTILKNSILSSDYDDKCPSINGNLLVFTSNRPGGFGGYDLYYSVSQNGNWSTPKNFGSSINSAADEYRPIVKTYGDSFTNDFMIFSSNRTGGKGGFDLYYVGINKMTK